MALFAVCFLIFFACVLIVLWRYVFPRVASFDGDFAVHRYGPGRKRAFDVLR
jgi:hypothetical protein